MNGEFNILSEALLNAVYFPIPDFDFRRKATTNEHSFSNSFLLQEVTSNIS